MQVPCTNINTGDHGRQSVCMEVPLSLSYLSSINGNLCRLKHNTERCKVARFGAGYLGFRYAFRRTLFVRDEVKQMELEKEEQWKKEKEQLLKEKEELLKGNLWQSFCFPVHITTTLTVNNVGYETNSITEGIVPRAALHGTERGRYIQAWADLLSETPA